MFAALAMANFEFKKKISLFIAMGPVTRLKGTKQAAFTVVAKFYDQIATGAYTFGVNEIMH